MPADDSAERPSTLPTASLLFLGSGVTVAPQMAVSLMRSRPDALLIATVLLATLPMVVGVLTLLLAMRRSGRWTAGSRLYLALLGVAALVVWAGWLVGPGLAMVAAFAPSATFPDQTRGIEASSRA